MDKIRINWKKINPDAVIPTKAHPSDVGFDLSSIERVMIKPMERVLIPTGIAVEIPHNFEFQLRPRSGLAYKHGITILNSPASIDESYTGEWMVLLINLGHEDYTIHVGERIAQAVLAPVTFACFNETPVKELSSTDRGEKGFGSSGK